MHKGKTRCGRGTWTDPLRAVRARDVLLSHSSSLRGDRQRPPYRHRCEEEEMGREVAEEDEDDDDDNDAKRFK